MRKRSAPMSLLVILMLVFQSYGYAGASPNGHVETDESRGVSSAAEASTTYYVDAVSGHDANDGTDAARPWATLDRVNAQRFKAGDRILFRAGSVWEGQLAPQGSGSPGQPIIIDKYGSDDPNIRPIIHGGGSLKSGRKAPVFAGQQVMPAVLLENVEYWEIRNLEITNDNDFSKKGSTGSQLLSGIGVRIDADQPAYNRAFHHIVIDNNYIHDVDGVYDTRHKENGGIHVSVEGTFANWDTPTYAKYVDLRITNNVIERVSRTGIRAAGHNNYVNSEGGFGITATYRHNAWNEQVYIARNVLNDIGGDAIILRDGDGTIVEHNTASRFGSYVSGGNAIAGIWLAVSKNTILQFNEVSHGPSYNQDGCAFDFDSYLTNTIYQYNYSHDNPMGMMLLMGGNDTDVMRYNVSINDGSAFRHFSANEKTDAYIYNNLFYYDGANYEVLEGDGVKTGYKLYNNIFYNHNPEAPTNWETNQWNLLEFSHNTFFEAGGKHHPNEPLDLKAIYSNPLFTEPGSWGNGFETLTGYKLKANSPLIDAGKALPESIVKLLTSLGGESRDFYQQSLRDGQPDIGIHEYHGEKEAPGTVDRPFLPQSSLSIKAFTSEEPSDAAMRAIDDDPNSYWRSGYAPVQSITLDLGGLYDIDHVFYLPAPPQASENMKNGIISNYNLYISSDGTTYTKIASGVWSSDYTLKKAAFHYVNARYVRLENINNTGGFAAAAEIYVRKGTSTIPPQNPDLIPKSSIAATVTSFEPGREGDKALDDNLNTNWHTPFHGNISLPQSITLDLKQPYTIYKLRYLPPGQNNTTPAANTNGLITKYEIAVSTDGSHFTTIKQGNWAVTKEWKDSEFPAVGARYIRLTALETISNSAGKVYAGAVELEVYKDGEPIDGEGLIVKDNEWSVEEDQSVRGRLLATDSDGRALSYRLVTTPDKGTLVLADASTGEFRYVPKSGKFGKEEISFEVSNGVEAKTGKAVFYISKKADSFIQNSGFETGSPSGWPVVSSTVKVVEGQSYSGKYAIQFERASTSLEQTVQGLRPNQWYVLEAWGKSERADNYQRIGVKRYDSSGLQQVADTNSTDYTLLKVPFKTGAGQTTATVFGYKRSSSAAPPSSIDGVKAWLDDFAIREYQSPTVQPAAFEMKAGQIQIGAVQGKSTEGEQLQYQLVSEPLQGTIKWNEATGEFEYAARSEASGTDQWSFIARDERSESLLATVTVRFTPAAHVVSMDAIPDHLVLQVGDTQSTVVQAVYSDGQQAVLTEELIYAAMDPTIVTILEGNITGIRAGATEVMVTWNGFTDRIAVQVERPPIEKLPIRLSFNEKKPMLRVGEQVQLVPTIHYDDGTSVIADSASVAYQVADKMVAAIDENGVILGIATGKTKLTIQCGTLTAMLEVMVKKEK